MHRKNKEEQSFLMGFTLIELIAVIVILAVLASIAVPRYSKTLERSRLAEAINTLGILRELQLKSAIEKDKYTEISQLEINLTMPIPKFFIFSTVDANDSTGDQVVAMAQRNGALVGGRYHPNYVININESGGFWCNTTPTPCPSELIPIR